MQPVQSGAGRGSQRCPARRFSSSEQRFRPADPESAGLPAVLRRPALQNRFFHGRKEGRSGGHTAAPGFEMESILDILGCLRYDKKESKLSIERRGGAA